MYDLLRQNRCWELSVLQRALGAWAMGSTGSLQTRCLCECEEHKWG